MGRVVAVARVLVLAAAVLGASPGVRDEERLAALVEEGSLALARGDTLRAREAFAGARAAGESAAVLLGVGLAAFHVGEYSEAERSFRASHALSGDGGVLRNAATASKWARVEAALTSPEARPRQVVPLEVVTTLYRRGASEARFRELVEALRSNAANDAIRRLHVHCDDELDARAFVAASDVRKVEVVRRGNASSSRDGPPSWGELFEYASRLAASSAVLVAHADVVFDGSLRLARCLVAPGCHSGCSFSS